MAHCNIVTGVTQEMIDNLRLSRENLMLHDLQEAASTGGDLECRARHGETPVRPEPLPQLLLKLNKQ